MAADYERENSGMKIFAACLIFFGDVPLFFARSRQAQRFRNRDAQVIEKLEPLIRKRDGEKNLSRLTFDELYEPLLKEEREFMEKFRNIPAKEVGVRIPWRGIATGKEELVMIRGQKVKEKVRVKTSDGKRKTVIRTRTIPPQFLPPNVYKQYEKMMAAMETDIGKRLYVDSGYRSSAYQLYLFVYFLKNHNFSVRETVKFVALPGYSEHGSRNTRRSI